MSQNRDSISRNEVPLPSDEPRPFILDPKKYDRAQEELLHQNQDLMARLTVNLRRVGELEHALAQKNEKIQHLKNQHQSISDASLTNRELLAHKQNEVEQLQEKLHKTEVEYALLYEKANVNKDLQADEMQTQKEELFRLKKFKSEVKDKVKTYVQELLAKQTQLELQVHEAVQKEHQQILQIQDLQKEILLLQEQMQQEAHSLKERETRRVEEYENYIRELLRNQELQKKQTLTIEKRLKLLENIDEEFSLAKNRAIALERSRFDIEKSYEEQARKLQAAMVEVRSKMQIQKQDNEAMQERLGRLAKQSSSWEQKYYDMIEKYEALKGNLISPSLPKHEPELETIPLDL